MSESEYHSRLVDRIIAWAQTRFAHERGLYILADCARFEAERRPWPINGFIPDVEVGTAPKTFTLLGEAKWFGDLETARSSRQISTFLESMRREADSYFVIAVPQQLIPAARNIVSRAALEVGAASVKLLAMSLSGDPLSFRASRKV